MIKVVHIGCSHRPDDIRIYKKECNSLANNGYDVTYITRKFENKSLDKESKVKVIEIELPQGVSPLKKPVTFIRNKHITYNSLLLTALKLKADIYHIHEPKLLSIAMNIKKNTNSKVVYDSHEDAPREIHDYFYKKNIFKRFIGRIYSFIFEIYENYTVKHFDAIIAATPFIQKRFLNLRSDVECICNYAILKKCNSNLVKKPNFICYVGGITPLRGITQVVNSLENTNIRLQLAGKISKDYLEELKMSKGWENVDHYGFISSEVIQNIYTSSTIGIVTLLPGKNIVNSLPIKMFEYMEAGLPIIASNFPLWRQIIEDNECGICVNPYDKLEISKAIGFVISNPQIAQKMGQNGRRAVEKKFNWGIEEQKLLKLYEFLVTRSGV